MRKNISSKDKRMCFFLFKFSSFFALDFEGRESESEDSDNEDMPEEFTLSNAMSEIQSIEDNITSLQSLIRLIRYDQTIPPICFGVVHKWRHAYLDPTLPSSSLLFFMF